MVKSVLRWGVIFLLVGCMGCSSVQTYMGPLKSKLVDGQTSVGDFSQYVYDYYIIKDTLYLKKIPMCRQMQQKIRVMQKQRRGLYLCPIEMAFFGLGILDLLRSYAIVEDSRREIPLAKYYTGEIIRCGKEMPAEGEPLIVRNQERGIEKQAVTDKNGEVDFHSVLPNVSGEMKLQVQLKQNPSFSFSYLYRAD